MAIWIVKTHFTKKCEQKEHFSHNDYQGKVIVTDGFRSCTYEVETNDKNTPQFEFTYVPNGDGSRDSINLNDCFKNNIVNSQQVEMFDGGCWGDVEFPDDMDDERREQLQEAIDNEGSWGALSEDEGWTLDDTDVWVWGPLEISNKVGKVVKIVCADDYGNVVDYVEQVSVAELPKKPQPKTTVVEMTDWLPVSIKPAYKGVYSTRLASALPTFCEHEWNGKKWAASPTEVVLEWRGLAKKPA